LGEVAAAAALVGQDITQARAKNDRLTLVEALRVLAMVAIRQQQWAGAEQALEEGLRPALALHRWPSLHTAVLLHWSLSAWAKAERESGAQ
jgi:hypothetical protein